jgi:ATP-binding cassette subfamily B protein
MERLNGILEAVPQVTEPTEPVTPDEISGTIEFRELTFGYGEQVVVRDINFRIEQGTRVGIVGSIGSGKSTLVRLLARLYPVPDGTIFIDGIDINRLPLDVLRRALALVPQEGFHFSRTVGENIAYGKEGASNREIEEAARLASLEDDLERFPAGYETLVGERGITLSGGQRQRLAIARALLKNPAILVLDDPLSAVDASTEEAILANLADYYGRRTVIIISHRISALRDCDRIVVMDSGRIVEQGNHDQLVAANGLYAEMNREQQIRQEIEQFQSGYQG